MFFYYYYYFCDEILLTGAVVPLFNSEMNNEFTGKSSLTSQFCAESSDKVGAPYFTN